MEETSHSTSEFAPENEIMNGLVSTMFWWCSVISGANDKTWLTDGHNMSECNAVTVIAVVQSFLQVWQENPFLRQFMKQLVGMEVQSVLMVKWKIHIRAIFVGANDESSGIRAFSSLINWRDVNSVKRAMFLQLGVELVPISNILLLHLRKPGCPGLLLFFGAWSWIEFESRSEDKDFIACWLEEDEIPFFLFLGDGANSETIPEAGH